MQEKTGRVIAGIALITIASTFLLYQITRLGYLFLKTSDHLLLSSITQNQEKQKLIDEKTKLDAFGKEVNATNDSLEIAMQRSMQWSDSVQRLMETSLDNMELIQDIYEQHVMPGEEKIDSLSNLFNKKSDDLLAKMEQYNQHEIDLQKSKLKHTGLVEKRWLTLIFFVVFFILFFVFLIRGFLFLR